MPISSRFSKNLSLSMISARPSTRPWPRADRAPDSSKPDAHNDPAHSNLLILRCLRPTKITFLSETHVRVLLTNDDGYDAPGLRALYEAVRTLPGIEIDIIAPAVVQSGKSHSTTEKFTCRQTASTGSAPSPSSMAHPPTASAPRCTCPTIPDPIGSSPVSTMAAIWASTCITRVPSPPSAKPPFSEYRPSRFRNWSRPASPTIGRGPRCLAGAVIAALCLPQSPCPHGADTEIHQGVRAAIESQPLSAIAISADPPVAPVRPMLDPSRPPHQTTPCWNVNLPLPPANKPPLGVRIAPVSTDPLTFAFTHATLDGDQTLMTYVSHYHERPTTPGTDVELVFGGHVTLSRLSLG